MPSSTVSRVLIAAHSCMHACLHEQGAKKNKKQTNKKNKQTKNMDNFYFAREIICSSHKNHPPARRVCIARSLLCCASKNVCEEEEEGALFVFASDACACKHADSARRVDSA